MKINVTTLALLLGTSAFAQAQHHIVSGSGQVGSGIVAPSVGIVVGSGLSGDAVESALSANAHAFCNQFHDDEWQEECKLDCWDQDECHCNPFEGSGSVQSQVRTVASGAVIIPAVEVRTELDCYTESSNSTTGHETQHASCDNNFHVAGTLGTSTYHCASGSTTEENKWDLNGDGSCAYEDDHDTDCPCHVGCKALGNAAHEGDWCLEDDECGLGGEVADAEEDIEERINHQIDKAIAEILSEAVERCISTSLKNCIELW